MNILNSYHTYTSYHSYPHVRTDMYSSKVGLTSYEQDIIYIHILYEHHMNRISGIMQQPGCPTCKKKLFYSNFFSSKAACNYNLFELTTISNAFRRGQVRFPCWKYFRDDLTFYRDTKDQSEVVGLGTKFQPVGRMLVVYLLSVYIVFYNTFNCAPLCLFSVEL